MIDKEEFGKADYNEKMQFVKKILSLTTHNSFTKDDLLFLLKWQVEQTEKMICCSICKHYKKGDTTCLKDKPHNSGGCFKDWELAE